MSLAKSKSGGVKGKVQKVEAPPKPVTAIFKPATEVNPIEGLKILVWGEPKVGKSHFALTAPRPTFVIDTEFGVAPIKHKFEEKDLYIAEVAVLDPITKEIDITQSTYLLEDALRSIIAYIDDNPDVRGTIVIDSITDVWDWLGIWLIEDAAEVFTKTGVMLRTEWGKANRRYYKMILKLLKSKWHVIATAKTSEIYSERGESTGLLKPKVQKTTEYWFDIIMQADLVDPVDRKRVFKLTKSRIVDDYGEFTNPTWDDIYNWVKSKITVNRDL